MEIHTRTEEKGRIVSVSGKLDAVSTPDFERRLTDYVEQGDRTLILDFNGLVYVTSAGLRSILTVAKQLKRNGGILAVAALGEVVKNVFEISGFTAILPIYETVADALEGISAEPTS